MEARRHYGAVDTNDAAPFLTFPFCPACNTILSRNATHCSRCGSAAVENWRLVSIASRLRATLLRHAS